MLHLLVEYAASRRLHTEPGFKPKRVRWAILFDRRGRFLRVQELGEVGQKRNRGREFPRAPDLTQPELKAGGPGCRHFLVDSAEVVTLLGKHVGEEHRAKRVAKQAYFVELLRRAAGAVPELGAIAKQLEDWKLLREIRAALEAGGARPTDNVTPAIMDDGVRFPVESDKWHDWWRQFRSQIAGERERSRRGRSSSGAAAEMRCLVSGELVQPVRTHPKIEGLADVGGLSMGDALASFKQESFQSYGLEQSLNAAVSERMAAAYRAGLNHLIHERGWTLAGAKVVHWFSGLVPDEVDPILDLERGGGPEADELAEAVADAALRADAELRGVKLVRSVASAEYVELLNYRYYVMVLSGAAGRVMVRDWIEGQFGELRHNRDAWFGDLGIVNRKGDGLAARPKFTAVLGALTREKLSDVPVPVQAKLWRVAVRGEAIPHGVMAQALVRASIDAIQGEPPNHARMGLLKAFHVRRGDDFMRPYLNEEHPHPAYHCGRLMALLADVQWAALGEVGAGVVQRYYAAASATPALVLGRLTRTAQFHLAKIDDGLRQWHDQRLARVWTRIRDRVPATLTLEEQSLFALGYYHQKAARFEREQTVSRSSEDNSTQI